MAPKTFSLPHLDAAENFFFARELEHIETEMLETKLVPLIGRSLVPTQGNIDPTAETYTYRVMTSFGKAQRIKDMTGDLPRANVDAVEHSSPMVSYGSAFEYSVDEVAAAARLGRSLDRARAQAAKKALDLQLESVIQTGDSAAGLGGLLNVTSADTFTPSTKAAGGLTWAVATADEILDDVASMITQVVNNTKGVERPTRLLLPVDSFELIKHKPRSTLSDTTILNFILSTNPGLQVMPWYALATAGAGSTRRSVAYDPTLVNVRLLMSREFEQRAPEQKGFGYVVNCRIKTGGVISEYPKSICYGDGI